MTRPRLRVRHPHETSSRGGLDAWSLLLAAAVLAGCRAKGTFTEADELRRQLDEARSQIAVISAERDEARSKLAEMDRVRLATGDLAADAFAALPRCAGIEIDFLSGLRSEFAADGGFDIADISIVPFDGRRRFVQVVGTIRASVDLLPEPGAAADPARRGSVTLGPADLREAYRAGLTGTHYTLRVPLSPPLSPGPGSAVVTVEFLDALSGSVHRASRSLALTTGRPAADPVH